MSEVDISEGKTARGAHLAALHAAKMEELFKDRKYTVRREVHLEGNQRFVTPFGNKGRHGFILDETGADPVHRLVVGESVLRRAAELYGSVELPESLVKKPREPKKPKPEPLHEVVDVTGN